MTVTPTRRPRPLSGFFGRVITAAAIVAFVAACGGTSETEEAGDPAATAQQELSNQEIVIDSLALLQVAQGHCLELSRRAYTALHTESEPRLTVSEVINLDHNLLLMNRGLAYVGAAHRVHSAPPRSLPFPDSHSLDTAENAIRDLCRPDRLPRRPVDTFDQKVTEALTRYNQQRAHFGVSKIPPMRVELARNRNGVVIAEQLRRLSTDYDARHQAAQQWKDTLEPDQARAEPRGDGPANFQEWLAEQKKLERQEARQRREREAAVAEIREQHGEAASPRSSRPPTRSGGTTAADAANRTDANLLTMRGWHRGYSTESVALKRLLSAYLSPPEDLLALQQICSRLQIEARKLLRHPTALSSPDALVAAELRGAMEALARVGGACAEGNTTDADAHMETANRHLSRAAHALAPYGLTP